MIRRRFSCLSLQGCGALVLVATLWACMGGGVRPATFRMYPDDVTPGDLRGPYAGQVFDATTRAPVENAFVMVAWALESRAGVPLETRTGVTSTDASGAYRLPALAVPRQARLVEATLLVYKRGYVAYRSDRRFEDLSLRTDFAQRNHQIQLTKWQARMSHAKHMRFVGGGAAVAALLQWELADAIAELRDEARPVGPRLGVGPRLWVAAQLLTPEAVALATGFDGVFAAGPLADEPDTATYSSQHLRAKGRDEAWDVALRVWAMTPARATAQYGELLKQLPGVQETNEIASKSFRAAQADIRGVGFLDAERGFVALLTCGEKQCADIETAVALARGIATRVAARQP